MHFNSLSHDAGLPATPAPTAVLVLDDERFDRHRLARLCSGLSFDCNITNAADLTAFQTALDGSSFDLILVDYKLPDGTGLDALSAVRMSAHNFNAATIMITGQGKENVAAEALSNGCADFLTKDELTPTAFRRAVTNALQKSSLTAQVEAQTFARAEVETVLEHFACSFARDIKPMVSRMLRQLRDLRKYDGSEKFEAIDETCLTMWETLVELERHTGPEMMALTLSGQGAAAPPPKATTGRRPPSPFSRINH